MKDYVTLSVQGEFGSTDYFIEVTSITQVDALRNLVKNQSTIDFTDLEENLYAIIEDLTQPGAILAVNQITVPFEMRVVEHLGCIHFD